jgi:alpha-glucoside transport system substrate-binding protein
MATATTSTGGQPTTAATEASTAAPSPSGATTGTAPAEGTSAATPQAVATSAPWKGEQIGGTVSVLAVWGGAEQDAFMDVIKPFQEQTGITVQYEGTRDLAAVLNTRIQGGNPPDVAGVPNPGQLVALAQAGSLKPLDDVLDMNMMQQQYDPGFLNLASLDGKLYGIFTKAAVKSLVWYNPKTFNAAGYQVPKTWDELKSLEQKIISDGKTPWCVGIDGGAGSGWPGTDWVEDILLHQAGPDVYDQWVKHEIPWTDPAVKAAFDTWGTIVNDEKMVYGGPQAVIATNFGQAFNPMFQDDPGCYLHKQADFITTFFTEQFPNLKAGEDYNFFVFPTIEESAGTPLEVAGDLFGMFNDTPQARALMEYLVTADAQSIWAKHGGFLSANKSMDPSNYPDPLIQQIGEMLSTASSVRFDGSDQLPQGVESTFSQGVLQYPGNAGQLDTILQSIESVAQEAYQK